MHAFEGVIEVFELGREGSGEESLVSGLEVVHSDRSIPSLKDRRSLVLADTQADHTASAGEHCTCFEPDLYFVVPVNPPNSHFETL